MGPTYLCYIAYCVFHISVLISVQAGDVPIEVVTDRDRSYNITVLGVTWLRSAPTFFVIDDTRYSTEDGSLQLETVNTSMGPEGPFGVWISTDFYYKAGDVSIVASAVYYATEILTFKVRFLTGASNTDQPNLDGVICGFPGFRTDSKEDLGFMSFRGEDLGFEKQSVGRWNHDADIQDGLEGSSPLTLFDKKRNTVTIGSLDNFMSTVMWRDNVNNFLYWGIMGGVDEVPSNFSYQILAAYAPAGIFNSFSVWGFAMRGMYYKLYRRPATPSLKKIGYWTDKGSYYFDKTAQGTSNYEDTLLRVFSDARNNSINYSYVQWDTWWFKKGAGGGVKEWTSPTDVFPHGEKYLHQKLNVPVVAKNNFWSSDTIYAKQNGGNFSFEIEGDMALPLEESFWDFIFEESKKWGLITYIQDNMTDIFRNFPRMKTDINFARDWLMSMAKSAEKHNVTIQFSGALPRMAMETMELPAVTQIRASPSYGSSVDQWKIGLTSQFGDSFILAVFKDVFLTEKSSKSPERESLVSVLSSGPVAIGDGIGNTNSSIVNRTCTSDGSILKANVPAMSIYPQICEMAFQDGSGPDGQVWATFSSVSEGGTSPYQKYGIIFVSGLTQPFLISPNNTGLDFQFSKSKIYSSRNPRLQYDFSEAKPFMLQPCSNVDYCLYYTSPVISLSGEDVLILGELDKWIPISNTRVQNITVNSNSIRIRVKGQPKELVKFWFSRSGKVNTVKTEINNSGLATLEYKTKPSPTNSVGHSITSFIGLAFSMMISSLFVYWCHRL